MSRLLERQHVDVGCSGELVTLAIGNFAVSMEFTMALDLSVALRCAAARAKTCAGVTSRAFHLAGVLQDSEERPKKRRFAPRVPERLARRGVAVRNEGQLVLLQLGRSSATFPYDAARTLSQWLRVRGKEARNRAGEKAHWSQLVRAVEA